MHSWIDGESGTTASIDPDLDAAGQLPVDPAVTEVIARTDTAGCSHGFLDACRDRHVRFVVGVGGRAHMSRRGHEDV